MSIKSRLSPIYPFLFLCLICTSMAAQNPEGPRKTSDSTPEWAFLCKSYAFSGILYASVTVERNSGALWLSLESSDNEHYIGGTVYLFLADNSIIVCTDKKQRSVKDNRIMSRYLLTASELQRLSRIRISDIRFSIGGKTKRFSSQTGHFKAVNRMRFFDVYNKPESNVFFTEQDISAIYRPMP